MISEVNIPVEDTLMRLAGQGAFQGGEVPQYSHTIIPLIPIALCGPFILFVLCTNKQWWN